MKAEKPGEPGRPPSLASALEESFPRRLIARLLRSLRASPNKALGPAELREIKDRLEELVEARTEALRESQAKYQNLIETTGEFIWEIDARGTYTYCSPQMGTLWGIKPEEMIGKTPFDRMPPGAREEGLKFFENVARSRSPFNGIQVASLDGRGDPITIEISGVPFFDRQGELAGYRGITRDITERERTRQELLSREALLRALTENSPDAIYVKDTQSRWLMANPAVLRIVGKSAQEALGKTDLELYVDPEIGKAILDNDRQVLEGRKAETFEETADTPDGRRIFLSMKAPWFDAKGAMAGIIGISHDITLRKQFEGQLVRDLDAMTRLHRLGTLPAREGDLEPILAEIVDAAIAVSGADLGNIQLIDPVSGDLRIAAHRGFEPWWLDYWNSVAKGQGCCGTALERGERVIIEDVERSPVFLGKPALDIQRRAGVRAVQSTPLLSRSGRVVGMFSTHYRTPRRPDDRALRLLDLLARQAADIIEHAQAEEALRESEERYRLLVRHAPAGIFELDLVSGRFTEVNEVVCRILGYTRDEFLAMSPFELMDGEGRERLLARIRRGDDSALNAEAAEYRVRRKDGGFVWALVNATYQREAGVAKRATVVAYDVSDRKRAEQALVESEERFRTLSETSPVGVGVSSIAGRLLYTNPAYERILGYDRGELLGRKASDLYVDPEDRASWLEPMTAGQAVRDVEIRLKRKDGVPVWVSINASPISYGGEDAVMGTMQDITERRRSDELRQALAEQERHRLGAAVEQASDAVIMIDLDGTIRYVNAAFESINKIERSAANGTSYFDFLAGEPEAEAGIRGAVAAGRPWRGPLGRGVQDGRPVELDVAVSPAKDASGAVIGGLITEKDVTQENALQRQLRHAQKMEALGTLAGGITHDFNNILGTIVLNTELALLDLEMGHPARASLPNALKAAIRGKELVRQIITFSRQREWEKRPFELTPVVQDTLAFLRSTLPQDVAIREVIAPGTLAVFGDPSQINQVVVNLCQNAAQALREAGGRIQVELEPVQVDAQTAAVRPNLKAGPYVRMMVKDNGAGMTPETLERIFEPFFTTRKSSGGTGLGLSVVHGIVKNYGGDIDVASVPGKGTVFTVYLPRWEGEVVGTAEPRAAGHNGHGERVLLVEDDSPQRNSLSSGLRRMGYKVVSKPSGSEALEAFRSAPAAYEIVITDQMMPGMSGLEMAAEISKVRPDIPIILCTGFSERVDQLTIGQNGVRELIMKPFTLRELSQLIRRTLEGRR